MTISAKTLIASFLAAASTGAIAQTAAVQADDVIIFRRQIAPPTVSPSPSPTPPESVTPTPGVSPSPTPVSSPSPTPGPTTSPTPTPVPVITDDDPGTSPAPTTYGTFWKTEVWYWDGAEPACHTEGYRKRVVSCNRYNETGYHSQPDTACEGQPKPIDRALSVRESRCYTWVPDAWGDYNSQCSTNATRTRNLGCRDANSQPADVEKCERYPSNAKPTTTNTAAIGTGCNIVWKAGSTAIQTVSTCNSVSSMTYQTLCTRDGETVANSQCIGGIDGKGLGAPAPINPSSDNDFFKYRYYVNRSCTQQQIYESTSTRALSGNGTNDQFIGTSGVLLGSITSGQSVAEQLKVVAERCTMYAEGKGASPMFCVYVRMGVATDGRVAYAFTLKSAATNRTPGYQLHNNITFTNITINEDKDWKLNGTAFVPKFAIRSTSAAGNPSCGKTLPINDTSYTATLTCQ